MAETIIVKRPRGAMPSRTLRQSHGGGEELFRNLVPEEREKRREAGEGIVPKVVGIDSG